MISVWAWAANSDAQLQTRRDATYSYESIVRVDTRYEYADFVLHVTLPPPVCPLPAAHCAHLPIFLRHETTFLFPTFIYMYTRTSTSTSNSGQYHDSLVSADFVASSRPSVQRISDSHFGARQQTTRSSVFFYESVEMLIAYNTLIEHCSDPPALVDVFSRSKFYVLLATLRLESTVWCGPREWKQSLRKNVIV